MSEESFKDDNSATSSFKALYDALSSTVWCIIDRDGLGTGFCVHPRGFILTCNHVPESNTVECFNFVSGGKVQAKVVRRAPSWDIALLELQDQTKEFDYVKMEDELDVIFCGLDVFSIAQNGVLPKCLMKGKVMSSFPNYNLNYLDSMSDDLASSSDDSSGSERAKLCIPKFVDGRFCSSKSSPGGPVFNGRGRVVGMIQGTAIIHYYALNHFISCPSIAYLISGASR